MSADVLTAGRVRELFDYNPDTGVFVWKVRPGQRVHVGDVAGSANRDGYRYVSIGDRLYMEHRLAWLHVHGVWPANQIDHRDLDRSNNRIANLREATNAQNKQNQRNAYRNNLSSGVLGVSRRSGGWMARIRLNGHSHCLGTFPTIEQARDAYLEAKRELHPFAPRV